MGPCGGQATTWGHQFFSSHHGGSRAQAQVVRLGRRLPSKPFSGALLVAYPFVSYPPEGGGNTVGAEIFEKRES